MQNGQNLNFKTTRRGCAALSDQKSSKLSRAKISCASRGFRYLPG